MSKLSAVLRHFVTEVFFAAVLAVVVGILLGIAEVMGLDSRVLEWFSQAPVLVMAVTVVLLAVGFILASAVWKAGTLFRSWLSAAPLWGAKRSGDHRRQVKSWAEPAALDLRRANLRGADLRQANLRGVDLYGADLSEACLQGADLSMADLREADLSWTDLTGADLSWANLAGADLTNAIIRSEQLAQAASLEGAIIK